jgi:hypothetical protein
VAVPQNSNETLEIQGVRNGTLENVWVGLKKGDDDAIWKRNGINYTVCTNWYPGEGKDGNLAGMHFGLTSDHRGRWVNIFDNESDPILHYCVCRKGEFQPFQQVTVLLVVHV